MLIVDRGEITFSKKLGFLETGEDVQGIIQDIEWRLGYFAVVSALCPSLAHTAFCLDGN